MLRVSPGGDAHTHEKTTTGVRDTKFGLAIEGGQAEEAVVQALLPYVAERLAGGAPLNTLTRHILGLFNGLPGARAWRRHLSTEAHKPGAGPEVIEAALERALAAQRAREAA